MNDKPNQPVDGETLYYSLEVVTTMTRLGPNVIQKCIQIGLIQPSSSVSKEPRYTDSDLVRLRKVRRLIQEIGLNWAGVEVVMRLTDELDRLHRELEKLGRS